MPPKKAGAAKAPKWTPEELLSVKHLGPAIIGQEKYEASQAFVAATSSGRFGPAILGVPGYNQAGPVKVVDGVPIFAETATA